MDACGLASLAKEIMETVKKVLLLSFVFAGVFLVLLIWVQGLKAIGTSGMATNPRAGGDTLFLTQTPTPPKISAGTDIPGPEYTDQPPAVPRIESTTPPPTLSQEEIQIMMTEEVDQ